MSGTSSESWVSTNWFRFRKNNDPNGTHKCFKSFSRTSISEELLNYGSVTNRIHQKECASEWFWHLIIVALRGHQTGSNCLDSSSLYIYLITALLQASNACCKDLDTRIPFNCSLVAVQRIRTVVFCSWIGKSFIPSLLAMNAFLAKIGEYILNLQLMLRIIVIVLPSCFNTNPAFFGRVVSMDKIKLRS